jgi:hypothetical protein
MGKLIWAGFLSGIALVIICAGIHGLTERGHVAEATPDTTVGVDANPACNTATSLGTINSCISVNSNDTFYIDVVVMDVTDLNSWESVFRFDESVLDVNSLNATNFFLGSSVWPPIFSCTVGQCLLGTFDTTGAGHTGSGVLGRLEITAIGPGISEANLDLRPGSPVSGVILLDDGDPPAAIGDFEPPEGDGYFDGTVLNAQIAVDEPCPGECLPDVDTDGDGFDDDVECYLPTDQNDDCPNNPSHDAWPLDIDMSGDISITGDVFNFVGRVGSEPGDAEWWQRLDLDMSGDISITGDVFFYVGPIGQTCS